MSADSAFAREILDQRVELRMHKVRWDNMKHGVTP